MQQNRRKHERISGNEEPCVVSLDQVHMEGIVVDESVAGVGIAGLDLFMMPFNKPVIVNRREGQFAANVRYVRRTQDHRFNVGVIRRTELTAEEATENSAMLINCYVNHHDWLVICMPIEVDSDQVVVQLWDGLQFRVKRADLVSLTRRERFQMLDDEKHLSNALEMYKLQSESPTADRYRIFEHEFGQYNDCPISCQSAQVFATV
jgi:hypothetical protein